MSDGRISLGVRAREAILPNFSAWVDRRRGGLSFHLMQIITGHGCFNDYLKRIGKVESNRCEQCRGGTDTAQHNLQECPAWSSQRAALTGKIGNDLTLSSVIGAMLRSEEAWRAVNAFATGVMEQKEEAERQREESDRLLLAMEDEEPTATPPVASTTKEGSQDTLHGS
ncbi:uncharacterized protein LOC105186880 [Harpegnathos saltator]|uniref:uncharacterized protein LOC105186880 n=1 Tax=Harpegnathos saltator TaxID=610380 RepID=UPI00058D1B24|nr:uncharacterized protein LOC105186880 [Harpegnathos saltator]